MYSRIILNSFQNPPGRLQESCSLQPARLRLGIMCLSHNHFHRFLSIRMMYVPGCGTDKRLLWLWYTSHLLRSYRATKSQSAQLRIVSRHVPLCFVSRLRQNRGWFGVHALQVEFFPYVGVLVGFQAFSGHIHGNVTTDRGKRTLAYHRRDNCLYGYLGEAGTIDVFATSYFSIVCE